MDTLNVDGTNLAIMLNVVVEMEKQATIKKVAARVSDALRDNTARTVSVKSAKSQGISNIPMGPGPDQMAEAMRLLGTAKALGQPTDAELKNRRIKRPTFESALRRMRGKERLSDGRANKPLRMVGGGLAGAAVMGGSDRLSTAEKLIGALIGGSVGAYGGKLSADYTNRNVVKAMKILKDRGILTPELLREAMPLLVRKVR